MYKKYYSPINIIILLIISIVCLFYFTWFQQFINPLFTSDSSIIKYFGLSLTGLKIQMLNSRAAYINTVMFFKALGFTTNTPIIYIHLFSWIVFLFFLFTMGRINGEKDFSKLQISFIIFYSFVYGIYFTNYSKDIMAIILFLITLNIYMSNYNILFIGTFMLLYGIFFRIYWLITFLLWIPILLKRKKIIIKNAILYVFIALSLLILVDHKVIFLTGRFSINNPASSSIHSIVENSSIFADLINYVYVLISLIIPIQGVSSIHIFMYYIWIWGILIVFYKYRHVLNHKQLQLFLLFICFLGTQALFEPDFGSALRHQLVWFPLLFCAMEYRQPTNNFNKYKIRNKGIIK